MGRTIGIDLGTTNSAMAVVDIDGRPLLIVNAEGGRTTPSVAARTAEGEWLIGVHARNQAQTNAENTLFSVKRLMGQRYQDEPVQKVIARLPYETIENENGDAWVISAGEKLAPPEVAAMILQKLKADAERYLGEEVTDAVITVPAYFNDSQRNATKAAGAIAGLDVQRIINEPTAAALAYGFGAKAATSDDDTATRSHIVVYDLGGGTFDVSVLRLESGVYQVISTAGDAFLGGDDFDLRIIALLLRTFREQTGIDLSENKEALIRIKAAAEQMKMELSSVERSRANLPYITTDADGPKHLEYELTRSEYEELVSDLVELTLEPCKRAMADANISNSQIDQILLVGGQTRMPLVQATVRDYFGRRPNQGVNPDEVVALGAAIQGSILSGEMRKTILLLDVTSQTLGTEVVVDRFSPIIPRNTTIPTSMTAPYVTLEDNQTAIRFKVLQGESTVASENRELGCFDLRGLRPLPAGEAGADVTFTMDADGILSAHAIDHETGAEADITITDATGLTERQIQEMAVKAADRIDQIAKQHR